MDINKLLRLIAEYEISDNIWWNTSLEFFVNCNDIFGWAMADAEPISTDEDIVALEQAIKDGGDDGVLLYCARKRGMRPQGALYKHLDEKNKELFNACGPEREINFFNPCGQDGTYQYKEDK